MNIIPICRMRIQCRELGYANCVFRKFYLTIEQNLIASMLRIKRPQLNLKDLNCDYFHALE